MAAVRAILACLSLASAAVASPSAAQTAAARRCVQPADPPAFRAVGRVQCGAVFGSGTLIVPRALANLDNADKRGFDIVLTAAHVILTDDGKPAANCAFVTGNERIPLRGVRYPQPFADARRDAFLRTRDAGTMPTTYFQHDYAVAWIARPLHRKFGALALKRLPLAETERAAADAERAVTTLGWHAPSRCIAVAPECRPSFEFEREVSPFRLLRDDCEVIPGWSGGPALHHAGGAHRVIGISVAGGRGQKHYRRVNEDVMAMADEVTEAAIAATRFAAKRLRPAIELREPVPNDDAQFRAMREADAAYRAGDYAAAIAILMRAIDSEGFDAEGLSKAYYELGRAHHAAGAPAAAIVPLTRAIKLARLTNDTFVYHTQRAISLLALRQPKRALEDADAAVQQRSRLRNPQNWPEAWPPYWRARVHMAGGRFADALKDVDAAMAMKPPSPAWLLYSLAALRGQISAHLGDAKSTREDLERALALARETPAATPDQLAWLRFLLGDFKGSAEAAAAAPRSADLALLAHAARLRAGASGPADLAAAVLDPERWPYPLVEVFLGKRTAAAALGAAEVPGDGAQTAARSCTAHFYLAQHAIATGDRSRAETHLHGIRETCRGDDFAAAWAAIERARPADRK